MTTHQQIIVYVRHPECLHNVNHIEAMKQGILNRQSPLTETGCKQRDITAAYLRKKYPDIQTAFCSTYHRTEAIPRAMGIEPTEHQELDERNMGVWHENLRTDVLAEYPEEKEKLKNRGYYHYLPPEGESCIEVVKRQSAFVDTVLSECKGTIMVSGHGVAGLCFIQLLLGESVDDWYSRYNDSTKRLANASVTVLCRGKSGWTVPLYNHVPWAGVLSSADNLQGKEA